MVGTRLQKLFLLSTLILMGVRLKLVKGINWNREEILSKEFSVRWDSEDPHFLTMEMKGKTRGYLAIGFSEDGRMDGADIIISWIDDQGIPHIRDATAEGYRIPNPDIQQDSVIVAGSERNGFTTVWFRRRWETCDPNDAVIGTDTTRLLWAWGEKDPDIFPSLYMEWHGPKNMGSRSLLLRSPPNPSFDNKYRRMQASLFLLTDVEYTFSRQSSLCKVFKFPYIREGRIIGFQPIIEHRANSTLLIQRIMFYRCNLPSQYYGFNANYKFFERYVAIKGSDSVQECFSADTPEGWMHYCNEILYHWNHGESMDSSFLPEDLALPIGDRENNYGLIQVDILTRNNELEKYEKVMRADKIGVKVNFSGQKRKNDAGILRLGSRITPLHLIPPFQAKFTTHSMCSGHCLTSALKEKKMKIRRVQFSGHVSSRKFFLRHIRHNVELRPIAIENSFDPELPLTRYLKEDVEVLPGDEMLLECVYNTSGRDDFTFGGLRTEDEMCEAYLLYYPRSQLKSCTSQLSLSSFLKAFKIEKATGDVLQNMYQPKVPPGAGPLEGAFNLLRLNRLPDNPWDSVRVTIPEKSSHLTVGDQMRKVRWKNLKESSSVEKMWRQGVHDIHCESNSQSREPSKVFSSKYPKYAEYDRKSSALCRYIDRSSAVITHSGLVTILISTLLLRVNSEISKVLDD